MSSEPNTSVSKQPSGFRAARPAMAGLLLVMGIVLLTLAGCQWFKPHGGALYGNNGRPRDAVTIFFSKYQGNQSVVDDVIRKLPPEAKSEPLQFALTELLKGPSPEEKSQGFYSEIPQGTKLLGLTQDNEAVTINLSKQFTNGGGSNSMEQRFEELKQTVFSIDSNHKINLDVEGKPLDLLGGEGLEVPDALKRQPQ
jgi:spore germination protein GerM